MPYTQEPKTAKTSDANAALQDPVKDKANDHLRGKSFAEGQAALKPAPESTTPVVMRKAAPGHEPQGGAEYGPGDYGAATARHNAHRHAAALLKAFQHSSGPFGIGGGTDEQAVWGALNQPPELLKMIKRVYDANFNKHTGKGLIQDVMSEMGGRDREFAWSQMARAGLIQGSVVPTYIKQTEDGQYNSSHRIQSSTKGATLVPGQPLALRVVKDAEISASGSYYTYQWYRLNDYGQAKRLGEPNRADGPNFAQWTTKAPNIPGTHKYICRMEFISSQGGKRKPEYIEYRQTVMSKSAKADKALDEMETPGDPGQALEGVEGYLALLKSAEQQKGSGKLDPEAKEGIETYVDKLKERLASTKDAERIPIKAAHVETENGKATPLNAFVAKVGNAGGQQIWKLVDITNPADRRLTGEYTGKGKTSSEAIRAAIKEWDGDNRYPDGLLKMEIPKKAAGFDMTKSFATDGMSFWDSIGSFFDTVGLVAGIGALALGVITAVAPIPGSRVVSGLIWTSIAASTAGAGISLATRHEEGFGGLKEDALDVLTIAGNMLGAGVMWRMGATVTNVGRGGTNMTKAFLIGQVSADGAQGVLLAVEYQAEYQKIMQMKDPQKRTDALLNLLGRASTTGAIILVTMGGAKADMSRMNKANFSKLGVAGETVDLAAAPKPATRPAGPRVDAPTPGRVGSAVDSANPLRLTMDDLLDSPTAQKNLHKMAGEAVDDLGPQLDGLANEFGVETMYGLKRDDVGEFVGSVKEKMTRKGYATVDDMGDMIRGRIECENGSQVEAIWKKLQQMFPDAVEFDAKEAIPYPRKHADIRAKNGMRFELQVGTTTTSTFIEKKIIKLPTKLAAKVGKPMANFHTAKYDILDKIDDVAMRSKYGLDDLGGRYDTMLATTGTGPLPPGAMEKMAKEMENILVRMAAEDGDFLLSLYTKGAH
jgi:hypothetical protein